MQGNYFKGTSASDSNLLFPFVQVLLFIRSSVSGKYLLQEHEVGKYRGLLTVDFALPKRRDQAQDQQHAFPIPFVYLTSIG